VRYLILSDLHANLEGLEGVLRQAEGLYDRTLCCGDLVGYGADPNAVVEWVRTHCDVVVRGNHDRACIGQEDLEWFNPIARTAALWTLRTLTPENSEYIANLSKGPVLVDGFAVVHGSPADEDEYMLAADEAAEAFGYMESRVAFLGHTHVQGGFIWNQSRVETIQVLPTAGEPQRMEIDAQCAYLINPGSVGQPRDGSPFAGYAIYDPEAASVCYWRTKYDVDTAQQKIREAGLPPILADRLSVGR